MIKTAYTAIVIALLLAACSNVGGGTDTPAKGSAIGAASEPVKLTFVTYLLSNQVKTIAQQYEQLHPSIDINLLATPTSGKDLGEALAYRDKFVTVTNTTMLAGKGPDLVELDVLPLDAYIRRGLLVELDELLKLDDSYRSEDYFANVLDHATTGGGLYGMPLYFSLVGFIGDDEAIGKTGVQIDDSRWTWADFAEIAKQLQQKGTMQHVLISLPSVLLREMVAESYSTLVTDKNGKQSFDGELFAGLMQQVKALFDDGLAFDLVKDGGGRGSETSRHAKAYFNANTIGSFGNLLTNGLDAHPKLYTKPHQDGANAGGFFETYGMVGINAKSSHKKEAYEFLRFLMEQQTKTYDGVAGGNRGFPINQLAYDKSAAKLLAAGTFQTDSGTAVAVQEELLKQLKSKLANAENWVRTPSDLDNVIISESEAFFSGQKTAQSVAQIVESKADLILNE
ncbi:ABC transporter substrate-binding protein [Paenibacillus sp. CF384]|uniref:ABC transporter substrate-binding protein n=1 Tax=Paenibacillus sp. CF384 TaxID=1884382 RepID=UPI00089B9478|nr:ABC transporter substrate-binding protein [Paenibacillus sp. CF384]SDX89730.1 multiple sugar transport system substrate-binding protein [Paenibacillus sp. CF384]